MGYKSISNLESVVRAWNSPVAKVLTIVNDRQYVTMLPFAVFVNNEMLFFVQLCLQCGITPLLKIFIFTNLNLHYLKLPPLKLKRFRQTVSFFFFFLN